MTTNKLLILCGPTATGKTKLAIELAKKFNGEIISADSRQVYRGMDIITGKDIANFKFVTTDGGIPSVSGKILNFKSILNNKYQIRYYKRNETKIWLLDLVRPDQKFNVADYYELCWQVIADIWQRGKLPVIVGGTGFYIKAVIEGLGTIGIAADWKLRNDLQEKTVLELQRILESLNPEHFDKIYPELAEGTQCKLRRKMNESDWQNPRRLIRAIEIAKSGQIIELKVSDKKVDSLFIGLTASHKTLYERIDQRVEERVKMGAEWEIKKLLDEGYGWDNSVLGLTIGYREWKDYFDGKLINEKVIQKWKFAEHNYARRQMTWFKKMKNINWFKVDEKEWDKRVESLVKSWYI